MGIEGGELEGGKGLLGLRRKCNSLFRNRAC